MNKDLDIFVDPVEFRKIIREMLLKMGAQPGGRFGAFGKARLDLLKSFAIESDIRKLNQRGMQLQTVAVATILINLVPAFDQLFKSFGDKRTKERKVQSLLEPLPVLRELDKFVGDLLPADEKVIAGFIAPKAIIESLEHYSQFVRMGDSVLGFLKVNSLEEVVKFAFADAVRKITGKYLDEQVSAVTGAALQKPDYDATAHRVWRVRSEIRLSKPSSFLSIFLVVLNELVSPAALPSESKSRL